MRLKRGNIAKLLLLTFVVGSQLAPLSHYLFMAGSDWYAVFTENPEHAAHMRHASATVDTSNGLHANLSAPDDHVICEYADLFATFAATSIEGDASPQHDAFEAAVQEIDEPIVSFKSAKTQSRAPPAA